MNTEKLESGCINNSDASLLFWELITIISMDEAGLKYGFFQFLSNIFVLELKIGNMISFCPTRKSVHMLSTMIPDSTNEKYHNLLRYMLTEVRIHLEQHWKRKTSLTIENWKTNTGEYTSMEKLTVYIHK